MGHSDVEPVFVLVHSPLIGPTTWRRVARELEQRQRQRRAIVPSLLGVDAALPPRWRYCVDAVAAAFG